MTAAEAELLAALRLARRIIGRAERMLPKGTLVSRRDLDTISATIGRAERRQQLTAGQHPAKES